MVVEGLDRDGLYVVVVGIFCTHSESELERLVEGVQSGTWPLRKDFHLFFGGVME
jgi:hypothetical protein